MERCYNVPTTIGCDLDKLFTLDETVALKFPKSIEFACGVQPVSSQVQIPLSVMPTIMHLIAI
jgi:hypothetical protein